MPTKIFPQLKDKLTGERIWRGISKGRHDLDFWSSFNVDFDRLPGFVVLSNKLREIFNNSDDDADFGLIEAFIRTDQLRTAGNAARDSWWILSNGRWFTSHDDADQQTDLSNSNFSLGENADTNVPTDSQDDAKMFENALITPSATDLDRKAPATSAWTNPWYSTLTGAAALTSSPHPLDVFLNLLLIGDGRYVNTVDDSNVVVDPRLTFPGHFQVNWITHNESNAYIGCNNLGGGNAVVFEWDGTAGTYNRWYELPHRTTLVGKVVKGIVLTITANGMILGLGPTSSGFEPIRDFPSVGEFGDLNNLSAEWIHRNGIIEYEKGALIAVEGDRTFGRMQAGLWYLNLENGNFYPRYAFTKNGNSSTTSHALNPGDSEVALAGALVRLEPATGLFAVGTRLNTNNAGGLLNALLIAAEDAEMGAHRGYFITPIISADNVRAAWQNIKSKFNEFLSSSAGYTYNDQILVKYRVRETPRDDFGFTGNSNINTTSITWASTTTFTGVLTTGRAVGDEVEIVMGDGAGHLAHISALSATPDGSATITVTIDITMPSLPAGTALAKFENWILAGSITDPDIEQRVFGLIRKSQWIQFKIELRGGRILSPKLKELQLEYVNSQK
ncbi:MAG: hypothetical protein AAB456_01340 [Patescibacteria group bacterium]